MPNPLQSYVNISQEVATYQNIQQQLGNDLIVFNAMNQVAQRQGHIFDLPTSPADYLQKHQEIEQLLVHQNLLNRQGVFFDLVEEIQTQLNAVGQGIHAERLRKLIILETSKGFKIKIREDGAWFVEWGVSVDYGDVSDATDLPVVIYKSNWGIIAPWTIIQYLNSGIFLYRQKSYATALALLSIALETTLRDVLSTRGYSFILGANKVDVYDFSRAQVNYNGANYILTFIDPMPKNPAELPISAGGVLPVDIQIRRDRNRAREDLLIKAPSFLIDHWAGNQVIQPAQTHNIGGLGEALNIARNIEGIVTGLDLPEDVEPVVKAVRNNLIHLSSNSLEEELPRYAHLSPTNRFTVKDFINTPNMVYDLVATITRFTNKQFVRLWENNIHI